MILVAVGPGSVGVGSSHLESCRLLSHYWYTSYIVMKLVGKISETNALSE